MSSWLRHHHLHHLPGGDWPRHQVAPAAPRGRRLVPAAPRGVWSAGGLGVPRPGGAHAAGVPGRVPLGIRHAAGAWSRPPEPQPVYRSSRGLLTQTGIALCPTPAWVWPTHLSTCTAVRAASRTPTPSPPQTSPRAENYSLSDAFPSRDASEDFGWGPSASPGSLSAAGMKEEASRGSSGSRGRWKRDSRTN